MKKIHNIENTMDAINQIITSTNLLECADSLLEYAKFANQEKQRKAYINAFNKHLTNMVFALMPRLFTIMSSEINYNEYKFFTGVNSVKLYLRLQTDTTLPPVRYLKSLEELANKIKCEFSEPSGNCVRELFIKSVIEYLNQEYSFVKKYYRNQYPIFIFLDHCHINCNSVCVATQNAYDEMSFIIFLFNLEQGAAYSPEYVFLHELGHVVQTKQGTTECPPRSFYDYMKDDKVFADMSQEEQKELFADGFASTVLNGMNHKDLDPFGDVLFDRMGKYFHHNI